MGYSSWKEEPRWVGDTIHNLGYAAPVTTDPLLEILSRILGRRGRIFNRNLLDMLALSRILGSLGGFAFRLQNLTSSSFSVGPFKPLSLTCFLSPFPMSLIDRCFARICLCFHCQAEKQQIQTQLLQYCKLDTLAMLVIWLHWDSLLNPRKD